MTNLMYSSRALFSPAFFQVLFRFFQLVLETRRQFETGLILNLYYRAIATGVEVVTENCLPAVHLAPLR